jgi:uncharacterized protein YjbJ (UPF0337 family)
MDGSSRCPTPPTAFSNLLFHALRRYIAPSWLRNKALKSHAIYVGTPVANRKHRQNLLEWMNMNWDRIEGNWKQLTGKVKEQWGKLTDSDLDLIKGKRDQLVGKIQEQYGISKDEAERQVGEFADRQRDYEKI